MAKIVKDLAMDYGNPCCVSSTDKMPEKSYPSFHYEGDHELGIPKEGTMVVRYCQTMTQEAERDGKEHYSCTVELREIISAEGEKDERPARTDTSASDALDAIREALEEKEEDAEDDEGDDE